MRQSKRIYMGILAAAVLAVSVPVFARGGGWHHGGQGGDCWSAGGRYYDGDGQWTDQQRQDFDQYRTERHQARLNYMEKQLGITSNQRAAWNSYAQVTNQHMNRMSAMPYPPANADSAAIMKFRADRAAEHAKSLNELSQATAKLESVLTVEQKKIFYDIGVPGQGRAGSGRAPSQTERGGVDRGGYHNGYHRGRW